MGTLSKRRLEDFGVDIRDRVENFRDKVGRKIDDITDDVDTKSQEEGSFTRRIEKVTAALPSATWLALAGGVLTVAVGLKMARRHHASLFTGMFAPPLLMIGLYNKLVKLMGSARTSHAVS